MGKVISILCVASILILTLSQCKKNNSNHTKDDCIEVNNNCNCTKEYAQCVGAITKHIATLVMLHVME
jgi:hypothetical protein